MRRGDAEERAEGGVSGAASVEAEDELVEVGLEVFATQAMIDAEYPALEVGEEAVGPGQHNMGGHAADDMRVVRDTGSTGIACPAVGLDGGAGGEIGLEEGMQAIGRIVGHLLQADATGAGPAVRDLDGADHEYLSLMAAPATASQGIVLAAADDLGADSDDIGRAFRLMSATCSERSRPAVPIDVGLDNQRIAAAHKLQRLALRWPIRDRP